MFDDDKLILKWEDSVADSVFAYAAALHDAQNNFLLGDNACKQVRFNRLGHFSEFGCHTKNNGIYTYLI